MGNSFNYLNKLNQKPKHPKVLNIIGALISASTVLLLSALSISQTITGSINLTDVQPASATINIVSPAQNTFVGNQTNLTAGLPGIADNDYQMFWYVDNGKWNWMSNTPDNLYKQASISFSNWTWHEPNTSYTITVVAVMNGTNQRYYSGVQINVGTQPSQLPTASPIVTTPKESANLYVDPTSNAAQSAASSSDPTMDRIMLKIAKQPQADWFGNWNSNIQSDVNSEVSAAANAGQVPVLVAYNIPQRDCGGYSSGGVDSPAAYKSWISNFASGIGNRQAIVILEPDALAQISCLSSADQATRYQLLNFAIEALKANPSTKVYLDAGNPSWVSVPVMADRLKSAGVGNSDGFSLNVSNFISTAQNLSYGNQLSAATGGKHFVVDTGRNGNGSNGQWCNPSGRALGQTPTSNTGDSLADYFLWVKPPGESDGTCGGGPAAGTWWPVYAEQLGLNAGW